MCSTACTHPLALPRSGDATSTSHFRSRRYTTFGAFPQAGTGTEIIAKCPLAGMQYFDCISASGTVGPQGGNVNFYVHLRVRGLCTEIMTKSPLAECNILIAFPQVVVSVLDRIPTGWKCRNFIAFNIRVNILFNVLFSSCNRPVFLRVLLHIIVNCKLSFLTASPFFYIYLFIFDCFSFFLYLFIHFFCIIFISVVRFQMNHFPTH